MKLSRREREIMDIVFREGPVAASDVQARMSGEPSNSAVRTFLSKLVEKGALEQKRDGVRFLYSPTESRAQAAKREAQRLAATFFDDDPIKAATAMLGMDRRISPEQAAELQARIAAMTAKGDDDD
jgi:predicted transcriptional regulator